MGLWRSIFLEPLVEQRYSAHSPRKRPLRMVRKPFAGSDRQVFKAMVLCGTAPPAENRDGGSEDLPILHGQPAEEVHEGRLVDEIVLEQCSQLVEPVEDVYFEVRARVDEADALQLLAIFL